MTKQATAAAALMLATATAAPTRADEVAPEPVGVVPRHDIIAVGVFVAGVGHAAATSYVPFHGTSCTLSLDSYCPPAVPERMYAHIPIVGPFVVLSVDHDYGMKAIMGVTGVMQLVGLVTSIVGATLTEPATGNVSFELDGGPEGAALALRATF